MRLTQPINRALSTHPDHLAIIDGPLRRNWREVYDRVCRGANWLAEAGVKPGDRVAVLADNSSTYFELFHAIPRAGGVIVPLNTRLTEAEISAILTDCTPVILLFSPTHHEKARRAAQLGYAPRLCVIDDPYVADAYEYQIMASSSAAETSRSGADIAAIFYTSGTTGRQKGVMLTHANLMANAISVLTYIDYDRTCVNIHAAPMFHLADIGIYPVTMVGGTHVFPRDVSAASLLSSISEHGVTHCLTVPILIDRMAKLVEESALELPSLRMLGYGGSPISPAALDRARRVWPGVDFVQGYGLTESPSFTFLAPHYHTEAGESLGKLRSAGEPVYSYEIAIRDPETGEDLPVGATGEICARGPHVMAGYWNNPSATAEALQDGWLKTGDAGHLDEDGFLTITDRIKDMIVTGGENVYSLEVENVLSRHPDVDACAVIGIPDAQWGEAVHAVVVLREGASITEQSLAEYCRERLAGYKTPKTFELTSTPLPLTSSGKVRKAYIRERYRATAPSNGP